MEKKITFKTADGCKRILAICLILVFLGSLFARLINADFGKVKIEQYKIDARGATIDGEMYYPAGTSSDDRLPCIIFMPGTASTFSTVRHFCIESARRGYVALSVSGYSIGLSEQPKNDELGPGSYGQYDVLQYARSLTFVDQTRIGLAGHSMGGGSTSMLVAKDCGYLSYNDQLINLLYDEFGQTFTEDEITQDAEALAAARLSEDQLALFSYKAAEIKQFYDTRVKSAMILGATFEDTPLETVTVGGHEVQRNVQCNICQLFGEFDSDCVFGHTSDTVKEELYIDEDVQIGKWYAIDDLSSSSAILGDWGALTILNSSELAQAFDDRCVRLTLSHPESHSKAIFSLPTLADYIDYFTQALDYNNGNYREGAVPTPGSSQVWNIGRAGNFIAMLAAIFMVFPLLQLLLGLKLYRPAEGAVAIPENNAVPKGYYWIFQILTVVATFFACKYAQGPAGFIHNRYFDFTFTSGATIIYIVAMGALSLALLILKVLFAKKQGGPGLEALNLKLGFKGVALSWLLAILLIAVMYNSLLIIDYLFKEDYRLCMLTLTGMKVEYWFKAAKYAIVFVIPYFVMSACINYNLRTDIPEWKEDLIAVVMGSVGVWLLCIINYFVSKKTGDEYLFSSFISTFQFNLWVPIILYILRKMYRITRNNWTGAVFCSCLVSWSLASTVGAHSSYIGQNWLSIIFNI